MQEIFDVEKELERLLSKHTNSGENSSGGNKRIWDGLRKFYMDRSGVVVTYIPVFSESVPGFFNEFVNVPYFKGVSSLSNGNSFDFLVLPKSVYGELSPEEESLHKEVTSLMSELYNMYKSDGKKDSYLEIGYRTYTLFWGVLISAIFPNGAPAVNRFENCRGKSCLFVFDRRNTIESLNTATNTKIEEMKAYNESICRDWIQRIFTKDMSNRMSAIQISCADKKNVAQFSFRLGSETDPIVPRDLINIPESEVKKLDDIMSTFLGYNYDRQNKRLFNPIIFKELRDHLLLKIDNQKKIRSGKPITPKTKPADNDKVFENKNNLEVASSQSDDEELPF